MSKRDDGAVKHTRGPWKAIQFDLHGDEDNPDPHRYSVATDTVPEFIIATIENGAPGDECATEKANATLIAAAPELLEALQELYDDQRGPLTEAMLKAQSALAKARQPEPNAARPQEST